MPAVMVSHWYRPMELDSPEPGHPITAVAPSDCYACKAVMKAVNDGHNSWLCPRCGAWLAQVENVAC